MRWPGDSTAHGLVRSGPLRVLAAWIGGFSAIAEPEAGDISEREMGRIRARQMDAVRQLTPVTMTVNLINVSIVLGLFWNSRFENAFSACGPSESHRRPCWR